MADRSDQEIEALKALVERQGLKIDSLERQARALFAELGDVTEAINDRDDVLVRHHGRLKRLEVALEVIAPAAGVPRRRRRPPLPRELQPELELCAPA